MWEKVIPWRHGAHPAGAGIASVKALEAAKAEIGFAKSISTVDAIKGEAPFDKKTTAVCHLGSLYLQYFKVGSAGRIREDWTSLMRFLRVVVSIAIDP